MLETLFKTIIAERGGQPDNSGELGKLLKQVEDMVGFNRFTDQQMHRITGGFANIINGLAALSNAGGDRHGLVNGQSIDDPAIARLCVHAAGTLGIAFIEMHLFSPTPLINGMIHGVNDPK